MSDYQEKIVNLETGEITFRDYNSEEMAFVEAAKAEALIKIAEAKEKAAARQAIFDRLGITAEEAAVLGL